MIMLMIMSSIKATPCHWQPGLLPLSGNKNKTHYAAVSTLTPAEFGPVHREGSPKIWTGIKPFLLHGWKFWKGTLGAFQEWSSLSSEQLILQDRDNYLLLGFTFSKLLVLAEHFSCKIQHHVFHWFRWVHNQIILKMPRQFLFFYVARHAHDTKK